LSDHLQLSVSKHQDWFHFYPVSFLLIAPKVHVGQPADTLTKKNQYKSQVSGSGFVVSYVLLGRVRLICDIVRECWNMNDDDR
jgi:hypothetical protein